jgi:glucose-6-phosphate isomerase
MDALQRLVDSDAVARLVARDASLFTDDIEHRLLVTHRLGWTDLAERADGRIPLVENLAQQFAEEGATDVVLLGMGGSSLAALVFERVFGSREGMPRLHVLDTTAPTVIAPLMQRLERSTTFVLVSSKSGTTIEPLSLYAIFRAWMEEEMERPAAGRHFVVVTDPESRLETLRQKDVMRLAITAPANVGGRFSALSIFGLTPAAVIGVDLRELVLHARAMEVACALPAEENPGALLAAWIADAHAAGRDKLTLVSSARYEAFGLWVEQLVAESTGKAGDGVVPVLELATDTLPGYGDDRAVVIVRDGGDADLARTAGLLREQGFPVFDIAVDSPAAVGAEFVRWEFAIALLGHLMGINPFDEPNVAEAKTATSAVLAGTLEVPPAVTDIAGVWPAYAGGLAGADVPTDLTEAFRPVAAALKPGDYLCALAYLPDSDEHLDPLKRALSTAAAHASIATCLELGPRYLHSTGQLHKGGANNGVFVVFTARDRVDIAIPGQDFTLGALYRAQAEGDFVTLATHDRRVMRVDLPDSNPATITRVAEALAAAFN